MRFTIEPLLRDGMYSAVLQCRLPDTTPPALRNPNVTGLPAQALCPDRARRRTRRSLLNAAVKRPKQTLARNHDSSRLTPKLSSGGAE